MKINKPKTSEKLWQPNSWQSKPSLQQVAYSDPLAVEKITQKLRALPPLVTPLEIEALKAQLGEAAAGKQFLLQGGDCAESFADCNAATITNKLKILLQISLILILGLHKPVIRVGRMAGQYAKPRSADTEVQNNQELPSYRGDIINHIPFTKTERTPDPNLMLDAYHFSALTLNYIRALVNSGFADLLHPEYWQLDFVKHSPLSAEYQAMVISLKNALDFLNSIAGLQNANLHRVDFYTSHEALHLPYEHALTRYDEVQGKWYNISTHYPWIGMRTSHLDGAHIEYIRGIANPIGVKIGTSTTIDDIGRLVETLNPYNEPGRLTLIHRFGTKKISEHLPLLIKAVQKTGIQVLWSCDPMHGNTSTTKDGIKTRHFDDILAELHQAFAIHQEMDSYLGGVHFELTGDNVTECIGGARGLSENELSRAYKSLCDPRLNYEQALEIAMLIVRNQTKNY